MANILLSRSPRSQAENISTTRFTSPWYPFADPMDKYFKRSLSLNTHFRVTIKYIIDIPLLQDIFKQCNNMYMGLVYNDVFLFSFSSFLRISNLVPHFIATYNPL